MQYRLTFPASVRKPDVAPHPLTETAGWTLIAALAYAPAALGCVRPWAITGLEILLTVAVALWLAGCAAQRRRPRLSPVCLVSCGLILLQGSGAVIAGSLRTAPGVVPVSVMADLLLRLAPLLGALLLTADLAATYPRWTPRLWWAIAWIGASVSLFGIAQKAGLTDLATRQMERNEGIPFATFNYHGNAGAFLNITVPLCAGLFLLALRRRPTDPGAVFVPALLLLVSIAGALVNVSRAAQAILCLLFALFSAAALYGRNQERPQTTRSALRHPAAIIAAIAVMLTLVTAAFLFRGSPSASRWEALGGMIASDRNARAILAKVTVPMAEEAGAFGSGPGAYKILFPHSRHMRQELYANFIVTEYVPGHRISMWSNAHNDYLQTVIEWGWIGSLPWGALLLGGLTRLLLPVIVPRLRRPGSGPANSVLTDQDVFGLSLGLAIFGTCVHALVDFPFQIASLQLSVSVLLGLAWGTPVELPVQGKNPGIISRLQRIL